MSRSHRAAAQFCRLFKDSLAFDSLPRLCETVSREKEGSRGNKIRHTEILINSFEFKWPSLNLEGRKSWGGRYELVEFLSQNFHF